MNRFSLPTLLPLALAAALPACGSLDANTGSSPTLATIQGQLVDSSSSVAPGGPVRVAVVWSAAANAFNVAEDLPVQPVFPSSFSIALDGPPPLAAMTDGSRYGGGGPTPPSNGVTDAGAAATGANGAVHTMSGIGLENSTTSSDLQVAVGTVVAYVDVNGNGKLDLVPQGASGYVDKILATNQDELVVYLQGTIPSGAADQHGRLPNEGYNLYSPSDYQLASSSPGSICADAGAPSTIGHGSSWQTISTPITLSVSSSPAVNALMCESQDDSGSESTSSGTGFPGRPTTYPTACDPNLACYPDGSSYMYSTCQTVSAGLCEGTVTSCSSVSYDRPDPVPSDWPCKP